MNLLGPGAIQDPHDIMEERAVLHYMQSLSVALLSSLISMDGKTKVIPGLCFYKTMVIIMVHLQSQFITD